MRTGRRRNSDERVFRVLLVLWESLTLVPYMYILFILEGVFKEYNKGVDAQEVFA